MKPHIILASVLMIGTLASCDDFFDTAPKDALSPSTFWKTEDDAQKAVVSCYQDWNNPATGSSDVFFADCMSDIAYSHTGSSSYKYVANGSTYSSSTVKYYSYTTIRRCNTVLTYIDEVPFTDRKTRDDLVGQVRAIRAWRYFQMNFWYGGVPLITDLPQTAEDAQLPRTDEETVRQFVYDEIDQAINELNDKPAARGRIAKGAALAIKMRSALYWGDLDRSLEAARAIQNLHQYEIEHGLSFLELFSLAGRDSKEIICSMQHVLNTYEFGNAVRMFSNADGGWSSFVPTQSFVESFEMANGMMPSEEGSGYDETHPFANRDPRLYNTVVYPGQDWLGANGKVRVFNTLDRTIDGVNNPDYMDAATNATHTGMIWAKYTTPISQYSASMSNDELCPIIFRYAEVLLTIAEINVEKNQNFDEVYAILDELRTRGGHLPVDRTKYNTQSSLRELVRRERCIELAGEGLRRADILRWKDENGKMLAETLLNGTLYRMVGTVDESNPDPHMRAVIELPSDANKELRKLEDRTFEPYQRYLPIPQDQLNTNPKLTQTPGYD